MLKGKIQMGTLAQDLRHWNQDALCECSRDDQICHDFHLFSLKLFLLSPKRPNTCSNRDMALSYLILSYLTLFFLILSPLRFKSHKVKTKTDSIAEVLTIYSEEAATIHLFSLSDSPIPSKSNSLSASSPPCGQVLS